MLETAKCCMKPVRGVVRGVDVEKVAKEKTTVKQC
jgi:hypothetical protein